MWTLKFRSPEQQQRTLEFPLLLALEPLGLSRVVYLNRFFFFHSDSLFFWFRVPALQCHCPKVEEVDKGGTRPPCARESSVALLKNPAGGSNCFLDPSNQGRAKQWELPGAGRAETNPAREWPFPTLLHSCLTYLLVLRHHRET